MLIRFVLLLLFATVCAEIQNGNLSDKFEVIVGGNEAVPHSKPWIGKLLYNGRFICGCSLISNLYALTAAHCVKDVNAGNYQVQFGGHRLRSGTRFGVRKIISHPQYNALVLHHDAALLLLEEAVPETDKIAIIPLAEKSPETNDACIIAGWGHTSGYGSSASDVLKEAKVYVKPLDSCDGSPFVEQPVICILGVYGASACFGDSGSPMSCSTNNAYHQQHGITSFVTDSCSTGRVGYTDVPKILPWIRSHIENYSQEDLELLLASIGTAWKTKNQENLLHIAAKNGFYQLAEKIIYEDSQLVNAVTKKHQFPIHVAAENGHCGIVSLLLKNGANVNSTTKLFDDQRETPSVSALQLSVYNGFVECIQTLLDNKIDINHRDSTGSTALHWAAEANKYEAVKMLVKAGADVSILNVVEKTAFDMTTNGRIKYYLKQKHRRDNRT